MARLSKPFGPPPSLSNLGPGEGLTHSCHAPGCYYSADLNIDALTDQEQFGPDFLIMDLAKHLPCPRCGSRDTDITRRGEVPGADAVFKRNPTA